MLSLEMTSTEMDLVFIPVHLPFTWAMEDVSEANQMLFPGNLSPQRGTWGQTPKSLVSQLPDYFKALGFPLLLTFFPSSPSFLFWKEPVYFCCNPENPEQFISLDHLEQSLVPSRHSINTCWEKRQWILLPHRLLEHWFCVRFILMD